MTSDETEKVVKILLGVDGGCSLCARYAVTDFCLAFPEHVEQAMELFRKKFGATEAEYLAENLAESKAGE